MVHLEEIVDVATDASSDASSVHSLDYSDASSILSDASSVSDAEETFMERVRALVDIVPPHRRLAISRRAQSLANATKSAGWWVGQALWVVSTTALLVVVPLAVEMERDAAQRQWEREMAQHQQQGGAQQQGVDVYGGLAPHLGGAASTPVIPAGF